MKRDGHTERHQEYEDKEERICEDTARSWPPASQEERLRRNQTCYHIGLGLLASTTVRK